MTSKILRPYQSKLKQDILGAWASGARAVAGVLATGGGKTVIFSDIIKDHIGGSCLIAHRQELVGQISLTLASYEIPHKIIAPARVVRDIVKLQMEELGRSYYEPSSRCAVAGVDTLVRRGSSLESWATQVTLWVQDEGHHLLKSNKWGKAVALFPNAKGLAVTATPLRADGKGLGIHAEGLIDTMVEGPTMRQLIEEGHLSEYRIFAPPSDLNLDGVKISSATGDYVAPGLKIAVQKSHIIGDVVEHYLRIAPGKLGITFATDIETATEINAKYNEAGVASEVLTSKTPDRVRAAVLRRFRAREVTQIVNVDLFGEGFDLPALEVVSMARPTQSFGLYSQQFGRALRPLEGKDRAIIIDHVGNVVRHGLPDSIRTWSLDSRDRRRSSSSESIPVRVCPECTGAYERIYTTCPYCGFYAEPQGRTSPEFVDGDLLELDEATLATMRAAVAEADLDPEQYAAKQASFQIPQVAKLRNLKLHKEKLDTQEALRSSISWYAGFGKAAGWSDSETYRRFYFQYGIDILTAQTLNAKDAEELATRINLRIGELAV